MISKINYSGSSKLIKRLCLVINSLIGEVFNIDVQSNFQAGIKVADVYTPKSGSITLYAPHDMPTGGSTGQVLKKLSDSDYNTGWDTPHYVPAGGRTSQVLKKVSNADYAYEWVNESGGGGGGQSPLYYDSDGFICIDYDLLEQR